MGIYVSKAKADARLKQMKALQERFKKMAAQRSKKAKA